MPQKRRKRGRKEGREGVKKRKKEGRKEGKLTLLADFPFPSIFFSSLPHSCFQPQENCKDRNS
jgi:hypothetical protein